MANNYLGGVSAVYSGRSIAPRNLFASGTPKYLPSYAQLDGSKSRDTLNSDNVALLRAGLTLGKITSGGKYAPSIIGYVAVALHDTSVVTTTMTLPAATVTEIARRIGASGTFKIYGPPTAAGTVATETVTYSAIASSTTLTITATSADFVQGSLILPADGSEAHSQFVTEPYGLDVLDVNGAAVNHTQKLLTQADINVDMIPFYSVMDASVKTGYKAALRANNAGSVFTFSDDR